MDKIYLAIVEDQGNFNEVVASCAFKTREVAESWAEDVALKARASADPDELFFPSPRVVEYPFVNE